MIHHLGQKIYTWWTPRNGVIFKMEGNFVTCVQKSSRKLHSSCRVTKLNRIPSNSGSKIESEFAWEMSEVNQKKLIEPKQHHKRLNQCQTRPLYRKGKKLTAVKVSSNKQINFIWSFSTKIKQFSKCQMQILSKEHQFIYVGRLFRPIQLMMNHNIF